VAGSGIAARQEGNAWPTRTLSAADAATPDARLKPRGADEAGEFSGATVSGPAAALSAWRVVLYAYEHRQDAERRVDLVNHNHPGLRAHLFTAANNGPYLVVTGGATSREEAMAIRKHALQLGVPRVEVEEFKP
jgi:hypothetical protein